MKGLGEVIFGFILLFIFYITLTTDSIPIIWTGALLVGIVSILSGIYHLLTSGSSPSSQPQQPVQNMPQAPPPPPTSSPTDLPPPPPQSRTCKRCGFRNKKGVPVCARCGSQL